MLQIANTGIRLDNWSGHNFGMTPGLLLALGIFVFLWSDESKSEGVVVPIPTLDRSVSETIVDEKQNSAIGELAIRPPIGRDQPVNWQVKSNARAVTINGVRFPDTGLFIPNSFVNDKGSRVHTILHYVNRVRKKHLTYGCQPDCSDGEVSFVLDVFNNEKYSFVLLPFIQSLASRNGGTTIGQGAYLGFRFSAQLSDTLGFSFGGETLKRFDSTTDLGRNAFVGFSKAFAWGKSSRPNVIANLGLGSGIYSTYGNILFRSSFRSDRSSLENDPNNFDFGLVGSLSYLHSSRAAWSIEYSGYGVGFGPSFRPFSGLPLTATISFYDLLWVPSKIGWRDEVTPNFFVNMSYSF